MKRLVASFILIFYIAAFSQAKATYEVTISASARTELAVVVQYPKVIGLLDVAVIDDYNNAFFNDLEDTGLFSVVKKKPSGDANLVLHRDNVGINNVGWLFATTIKNDSIGNVEVTVSAIDTNERGDSTEVFNKRYIGKKSDLRRIAHDVSDDIVLQLTGYRGVASTRIVFAKEVVRGIKEIYQIDRDGTNIFGITSYRNLTISPAVANDGKLAYVTYKGGRPEIWGQRIPGAPHVRLYPQSNNAEEHYFCPSWSPDNKRLAFVKERRGNADIVVLDIDSARIHQLTSGNCINTEPSWNPAGTQLAFTSDRNGTPQIFLMSDDGSNVRRLTQEGGYNTSPAWSPHGSMIAYVSRFDGKFSLFVYKLGEGKSYQITTSALSSESPSWSPDERFIVFVSSNTGGMQLYTVDLSGNILRKVGGLTGCQSPKWTHSR